jgi:hypothetical protein
MEKLMVRQLQRRLITTELIEWKRGAACNYLGYRREKYVRDHMM